MGVSGTTPWIATAGLLPLSVRRTYPSRALAPQAQNDYETKD
jgi:hypothetical protein